MQYTDNFSLKKPQYGDTADIADINDNADDIDNLIHQNRTMIAPAFDSTKAYVIGDPVVYLGELFVFIADKAAGAWDATKVEPTTAAEMGGGGTEVVANPSGSATAELTKIDIGGTKYNTNDATARTQLNAMKTGFDGVVYPSPAAMVRACDQLLSNDIYAVKNTVINDEYEIGVTWKVKRAIRENNLLTFANTVTVNDVTSKPLSDNRINVNGTASGSTIIKMSNEINLDHTKTYTMIIFFGDSAIRGTRPGYLYYGTSNQVKQNGTAVSFTNNPTDTYSIKSFIPDSDYTNVSYGIWYAQNDSPNFDCYVFLVEGEYTSATAFNDLPSLRELSERVDPALSFIEEYKDDIKNNTEVVQNIGHMSSNIIDPGDILSNTAITISTTGKYTTSTNNEYNSVLDLQLKGGVTYTIMPVRAYQIMSTDDTTVIEANNTNHSEPFTYTPAIDCLFSFSYYKTQANVYISDSVDYPGYEPYEKLILTQSFAKITNPLQGKTIYNFGDSVSNGEGTISKHGPAELVAEQFDMICTDYSVSGASITKDTETPARSCIQDQIANASSTCPDFILLAGGINDLKFTTVGDPPAQPTSYEDFWQTYINGLDTTKFSGAFEKTIFDTINKYPAAQLIYMFENKMFSHYNDGTKALHDCAIAICKKWDVQVIDFWEDGGLNLAIKSYLVRYGSTTTTTKEIPIDGVWYDGTHPNEEGYRLFFVPKLARTLMERCPVYNSEN